MHQSLSQWTGAGLLSGLIVHLRMNAEIYRLFFDLSAEQLTEIENLSVLPIWMLIIGLVATGQLQRGRTQAHRQAEWTDRRTSGAGRLPPSLLPHSGRITVGRMWE